MKSRGIERVGFIHFDGGIEHVGSSTANESVNRTLSAECVVAVGSFESVVAIVPVPTKNEINAVGAIDRVVSGTTDGNDIWKAKIGRGVFVAATAANDDRSTKRSF